MRRRKRAFDLVMVSGGMVVFAPVMVLLAALIRWEDGGEVFFRQQRVGRGSRPFGILKFRSMRDEVVTTTGRWMRGTGLDEIAQFLNILQGEMSLVGPRPLTSADLQRLGWAGQDMRWRLSTKPGVTGLAQVFGGRGAETSRALDRAYIGSWSLRLDVELVAISFAMNALGKARVRRLLTRPVAQRLRAVRLQRAAA